MHRLTGYTEVVIIEYGFLDNAADFNHYKNDTNFYKAAEAIVKVLCEKAGVRYKVPSQGKQKATPQTIFRVQAGAYSNLENAEQQVQKLKKAGFDAFITMH